MKKYIFLSMEGHATAPDGAECDNCQELGTFPGNTPEEAWEGMLKEEGHEYITKHGYDKEGVFAYEIGERFIIKF